MKVLENFVKILIVFTRYFDCFYDIFADFCKGLNNYNIFDNFYKFFIIFSFFNYFL